MNKKILNAVLVISILIVLVICIGADENSTFSNDSQTEVSQQETNNSSLDSPLGNTDIPPEILTDSGEDIYLPLVDDSNLTNDSIIQIASEENLAEENKNISLITVNPPENFSNFTNESNTDNKLDDSNYGSSDNKEENISNSNIQDLINTIGNNSGNDSNYSNQNNNQDNYKSNDICFGYNSLGKKVIEIKSCEEGDIEVIDPVQELEKNEFEKEVIISSQEPLDKPLRVYSYLTTEAEKENIQIYWVNEDNLEITNLDEFSVDYYDMDDNGLIDEISWVVPHLSEQRFNVVINMNKTNESIGEIVLTINNPPSGEVSNPINFDINVNYSGNFSCNFEIGNQTFAEGISSNQNYSLQLPNGNYNWGVACYDTSNTSIFDADSGDFSINEGFSIDLTGGDLSLTGERIYFLDLVKKDLKSNGTANIHSEKPSNVRIELKRDGSSIYNQNLTLNNSNYSLPLNKTFLSQAGTYNLTAYFDKPSAANVTSTLFYVASANLSFNPVQIQEGQSVTVTASINSPVEKITIISIYYGDGDVNVSQVNSAGNKIISFNHKYNTHGGYTVNLIGYIGIITFTIQKNGITVTDVPSSTEHDTDAPKITLIDPDDDEELDDQIINFSYKATDDVKIQNC
ncbi:MAG TPA: hypothetical protein VJ438_01205, partial [Candidatus Nanoarchaeia archaeon]|nr:hypothetical protein [Candidatus Nanoarchaeia archaeon]